MNDLQIDKALALAIGWKPEQIKEGACIYVNQYGRTKNWVWSTFSHKDWNVISPIAQVYDCFPKKNIWGDWFAIVYCGSGQKRLVGSFHADTPQKAIALAVIGASK